MQPPRVWIEGEEVIVRQIKIETSLGRMTTDMQIDASMTPDVYQAIIDGIHRREKIPVPGGYAREPIPFDDWLKRIEPPAPAEIDKRMDVPPLDPPAITYTDNQANVARGLGNAMRSTEKTREWVKQKRASSGRAFEGLGIGVNIRKVPGPSSAGEFELHISIFDQSRVFLCKDDFDVLERIQETMEEMFQ